MLDKFAAAYNQILSTSSKSNEDTDNIQILKNVIFDKLQYFIDKNDYQNYLRFLNFKYRQLDLDKSFNDIKQQLKQNYEVNCDDEFTFRFKIVDLTNKKEVSFSLVPQKYISLIKNKYDFYFNGGTIAKPTSDLYYVFINGFKTLKDFKELRNKNIKALKQKQNNCNQFNMHQETMNDVCLQYMNYFRNKGI